MYRPAAFRNDDPALLVPLMRHHPFATVVGVRRARDTQDKGL